MNREEMLKTAKPILFNTEMVRAIQSGRKMVTRRVIKPQPTDVITAEEAKIRALSGADPYGFCIGNINTELLKTAPYYTGNYLYVRETWGISNFDIDEQAVYIVYKAGDVRENCQKVILSKDKFEHLYNNYSESEPDWHPSIHMPKEAARIFLRVTNIRVERLQDMTEEDAYNEGWCKPWCSHKVFENYPDSPIPCEVAGNPCCPIDPPCNHSTPELFGADIWDKTIKKSDLGKYGWEANPWVWVIEFEKIKERPNK